MSHAIVGTCSRCHGPVGVPMAWWGTVPPQPTCQKCGAVAAGGYGPVIPMDEPPRRELASASSTYRGPAVMAWNG